MNTQTVLYHTYNDIEFTIRYTEDNDPAVHIVDVIVSCKINNITYQAISKSTKDNFTPVVLHMLSKHCLTQNGWYDKIETL